MRNLSSSISILALGVAVSATLLVGGCNKKPKDDTATPAISTSAKSMTAKLVKSRNVSDAEALQALKLMGLETSGSETLTWEDRKGGGGDYTFTDLGATDEAAKAGRLQTMIVRGVHMEGDKPAFDQIMFNGFNSNKDDTNVTIQSFSLTNPTPALATALALTLGGDEDAFDNIEGDIGFSALHLNGVDISDDESVMSLAGVKLVKNKKGKGAFVLNNFKMEANTGDDLVTVNLGSINVAGVNFEKYKGVLSETMRNGQKGQKASNDMVAKLMSAMNPYDPDFENFSLRDFNMNVGGLLVNMDSMTGKTEKKGSKVIMHQIMSPLSITPPQESTNFQIQQFASALKTMGYESLEFTMEQNSILDGKADSMIVKDSYIALKDGFKLSFDYDLSGYKAYMDAAVAMAQSGETDPTAAMSALIINHSRIGLRDDSIVDRGFKVAAEMQGGSPDGLKMLAKVGLGTLGMRATDEGQQQIADQLAQSLGAWIDDGGTLVFDFNPKTSLSVGQLQSITKPGGIEAADLGLTVTHEK